MPSDHSRSPSPSDATSPPGLISRGPSVPASEVDPSELPLAAELTSTAVEETAPTAYTVRLVRPSQQVGIPYDLQELKTRRVMLDDELLCYEKAVEFVLLVLFSHLPEPTEEDIKKVRTILVQDGTLSAEGWKDLFKKFPKGTKEHIAYNKPIANVINGIIAAIQGIHGNKSTPPTETTPSEAKTRVKAWNQSGADRAFICDGHNTWVSERPSSARCDGALSLLGLYRMSKKSENLENLYAEDIFLGAEFKVVDNDGNRSDNYKKIIHGGLRLLQDPCRRYAFGLTIEDKGARLYFFSRSFVLVSERFDINENADVFIRIFSAMAIATPEQLGWDTSIKRVLVGGPESKSQKIQYQIKVGQDTWYQTVRQLADFRANDIVGRATRVWEVVKLVASRSTEIDQSELTVEDPETTYALKDFWMDCLGDEEQEAITIKRVRHTLRMWMKAYPDAPPADDSEDHDPNKSYAEYPIDPVWLEAPVKDAYAADAEPHFEDEKWGDHPYDRYFPHVLVHGFVKLSSGDVDRASKLMAEDTFTTLLGEQGVHPVASVARAPATTTGKSANEASTRKRTIGEVSAPPESGRIKHMLNSARLRDAVHYRQVIEHVGTPLDDVSTFNEILSGLRDAAIALRWFFRAGRIHRDLSLGNLILVYIKNKDTDEVESVVQLHDWEYSRSFISTAARSTHGFKTGTPLFMACEIQTGKWAFPKTVVTYYKKKTLKKKTSNKGAQPVPQLDPPATPTIRTPPFIPTPLHDLEPLFWMLIWIMCSRSLDGPVLHPWQDTARRTFYEGEKPTFLRGPQVFVDAFVEKYPHLGELREQIVEMAKVLVTAHEDCQSKVPGGLWTAAYADHAIPQAMVGLFDTLSSDLDSIESSVKLCKVPPQQIISHNAKRQKK